ncbi:hypothetical protein TL16_g01854 [Triparma laevis f. inornata]|uniref:Uncharacterized protein n=2 Tax=Triparma laevis TaxID=1534972 RepID=A0A9W7C9X8_9STRA|nr:hypothetical protein TL16_g01854 [Triparma laevis f. inornata]GMI04512.1 hypothetical protein TrLO_g15467 [Triparma laevis f. longispina]
MNLNVPNLISGTGMAGAALSIFAQTADHFIPPVSSDTWDQRYWVDDSSFSSSCDSSDTGCVVFLMLGGEGEAGPPGGHMMEMAEHFGAMGVSIEHRFYGESIIPNPNPNEGNFTNEHLQLLSVNQALQDYACFIQQFPSIFNLPQNTRFYTFGGSYSGELASWMRIKYPNLVSGAIASSAPVSPIADYWGYDPIIIAALANPTIGGSSDCADSVVAAFQSLRFLLLSSDKISKVLTDFKLCPSSDLSTDMDKRELLDFVSDDFMGLVQYNDVNNPEKNIKLSCNSMTSSDFGESPYDRLVNVTNARLTNDCLGASYEDQLAQTCDGSYAERAWLWQMCADGSGHDQTCYEDLGCPFVEEYASFDQFLQFCSDCFGVDEEGKEMEIALKENFASFGGNTTVDEGFDVTKIVYINGDIDPFHFGGVSSNTTSGIERDVIALIVEGGSHCQDMKWSSENDSESMQNVKLGKLRMLEKWINNKQ